MTRARPPEAPAAPAASAGPREGYRQFALYTVIGGSGVLLRDGEIPALVDSTGGAGFARARHPRTALGWAPDGRLLLVVVDGRQPGYSAGMTLRELARTMRALGATDALNLDGGGSSTLVAVGDSAGAPGGRAARIVNRPSDRAGERPVANAVALVRECAR